MDALRIMRWQDEFELVALDYCVTEASPGPHDISYLFDRFAGLMEKARG